MVKTADQTMNEQTVNGRLLTSDQRLAAVFSPRSATDTPLATEGDDEIVFPEGPGASTVDGGGGRDTLIVTGWTVTLSPGQGGEGLFVEVDGIDGEPEDESVDATLLAINVEIVEIHATKVTISGDFAQSGLDPVEVTFFGDDGYNGVNALDFAASGRVIAFGYGGNDLFRGGQGGSLLDGGDGNDQLIGHWTVAANDVLIGGDGNDYLDGQSGDDVLIGGAGQDDMFGYSGIDTASYAESDAGVQVNLRTTSGRGGHAEGDLLFSVENLVGSAYADVLIGSQAANLLDGGDGNDVLEGSTGADQLIGGSGNDTARYTPSAAAVSVSLASGNALGGDAAGDTLSGIEHLIGSAYADFLKGDSGANSLAGDAGDDMLLGGAGDDVLLGGAGGDVLSGGDGIDTGRYAASNAGVAISLLSGAADGGDATGDAITGVENLVGSSYADFLKGDANANLLQGEAGNDWLEGGRGNDVLQGGAGVDTARYAGSDAGVAVSLMSSAANGGDATGDVITGVENLIGSSHADFLKGDATGNLLQGAAGNDRLEGGQGNDVLEGGAGADQLDGGDGSDFADYSGSNAGVSVSLRSGSTYGGHAAGDTFSSIENLRGSAYGDFLKGGTGRNLLEGGDGDDSLDGSSGDDTLEGGDGDDVLSGGTGADVLTGGTGIDTADYSASGSAVAVSMLTGAVFGGDAKGDQLSSIENLIGSAYDDYLAGTNMNNRLSGGNGDDRLSGEGGDDVMNGGSGDDVFIFADGFGDDTISDFTAGAGTADRIDFSDHTILESYSLVMTAATQVGNDTIIDIDTDTITLIGVNKADLHPDDFIF